MDKNGCFRVAIFFQEHRNQFEEYPRDELEEAKGLIKNNIIVKIKSETPSIYLHLVATFISAPKSLRNYWVANESEDIMAYNLARRSWYDWRRHHNIIQSVNFVLGLILVIVVLVFLITGERLGSSNSQMNTYMLGLCGVLALWAGVTDNTRIIYVIDMLLGLIFISSSTGIAIFNDNAIRSDLIIRTLAGLVFLITAYRARHLWQQSKIKRKNS